MTQANTATTPPQAEPAAAADQRRNGAAPVIETPARAVLRPAEPASKRTLALFCYEAPDSFIGQHVARLAAALARRSTVHLFARHNFELPVLGLTMHRLGDCAGPGLIEQVEDFGRRAAQAFTARFPGGSGPVSLLGFEWSSIPALGRIQETRGVDILLSLHSLERQRSDMTSELSQRIHAIELEGLARARFVLVQQPATADLARSHVPMCGDRLVHAQQAFPAHQFETPLDPGAIKARYQVGPIDPMILYIGDLDPRHGPDVLMKSVPTILKNHKQARFVFVGLGDLYWPLRVHARYLLLEHAVRLVGSVTDRPIFDLVQAADLVVVPSREVTEWWPIQAAWAAGRPVVASHPLVQAMQLRHEEDCLSIYAHESSCIWGIERALFDPELRERLGAVGRQKLAERFGWSGVSEQIEHLLSVKV